MIEYLFIGDILHIASIVCLLAKLVKTRSCGGVSGKTQLMFAIMNTTRQWDVFLADVSTFNSILKVIYIASYYIIVLLIFLVFRKSYRSTVDTLLTEILLLASFVLALQINHKMAPVEILRTFSIYLEAMAILPQIYMIYRRRVLEESLIFYLISLGLYRLFYIFNWIYRYSIEGSFDKITDTAGLISVVVNLIVLVEFCAVKIKVTDKENISYYETNMSVGLDLTTPLDLGCFQMDVTEI